MFSEFSLIDGLVRVGPLMKSVAAADMPAVAITDRNNFFGLIKAYKAAEREGVKLIIGLILSCSKPMNVAVRLPFWQSHAGYEISPSYFAGLSEGQFLIASAAPRLDRVK